MYYIDSREIAEHKRQIEYVKRDGYIDYLHHSFKLTT